jgi:hypothetical protein
MSTNGETTSFAQIVCPPLEVKILREYLMHPFSSLKNIIFQKCPHQIGISPKLVIEGDIFFV